MTGLYWFLIVLTVTLCFIDGVPTSVIILVLVLQKLVWAINLAKSCGCLKGTCEI